MEKPDNTPAHRTFEVEQKYVVSAPERLLSELARLGLENVKLETHQDIYFRHPSRNFRETDEALRIRVLGDSAVVTYKGPRLPGPVKTRPEIELDIRTADIEQWSEMYQHLGFLIAAEVHKTRQVFQPTSESELNREFGAMVVAVDRVEQLGSFAEIEQIVSDKSKLDEARRAIETLAERLGLMDVQPKSYLGMLLTKLGIEA